MAADNLNHLKKPLKTNIDYFFEDIIKTHIEKMGELEKLSVKHFLETGSVNGSFYNCLKNICESCMGYGISYYHNGDVLDSNYYIEELTKWTDKYTISFQFWGRGNNNVFIEKGDVELFTAGGEDSPIEIMAIALQYIHKINKVKNKG